MSAEGARLQSAPNHVDWIADCIADLMERGGRTIEATPEAEEGWVAGYEVSRCSAT